MLPELPLLGALGVVSTGFLYVQGMYPGTGNPGQVTVEHPSLWVITAAGLAGSSQSHGEARGGLQSWGDSQEHL